MRAILGFLAILTTLSTSVFADELSTFQEGVAQFNAYKKQKLVGLSHIKHAPVLLQHGEPSEYVVVLIHGLYESPNSLKGISQEFYAKGMNVVMPLLAGHWQKNLATTDAITYKDWLRDIDLSMSVARKLGKKTIVAGFSLGAVLATEAAFRYPGQVNGLFLWSPAYGFSGRATLATSIGKMLGIDANKYENKPVDGVNVAYYSLKMASQISELNTYINVRYMGLDPLSNIARLVSLSGWETAEKIKVPTFLVYSKNDEAINLNELKVFYQSLKPSKKIIVYEEIDHVSTPKSRIDANPIWPDKFNPYFEKMIRDLNDFIDLYM